MVNPNILALDSTHPDCAPDCMGFKCGNCGILVRVKLPVSTAEMVAMMKDFGKRHYGCSTLPRESAETNEVTT